MCWVLGQSAATSVVFSSSDNLCRPLSQIAGIGDDVSRPFRANQTRPFHTLAAPIGFAVNWAFLSNTTCRSDLTWELPDSAPVCHHAGHSGCHLISCYSRVPPPTQEGIILPY